MQHFPVFMAVKGRRIVVSGGGDAALAKLRLLLKTEARIEVYATEAAPEIEAWAAEGKLALLRRHIEASDLMGAVLAYGADEEDLLDARLSALAAETRVPHNIVDSLEDSAFITPAIVDRDPVVVAIGTEGAAPVLARSIKAELEARLPSSLGLLTRVGKSFRQAAERLPMGRRRRDFWADYYGSVGPQAHAKGGEEAVAPALAQLLADHLAEVPKRGHVDFVGAGPGDPELLTVRARRALDAADVVIHDRLVTPAILDLARREALIVDAGKEGFGPATPQAEIDALIVRHAKKGRHVVRLKAGDPTVFGRLDEEIEAVEAAGVSFAIVPGITAASAAVAAIGQSLTKRGRNSSVRLLTGHDVQGFADHDWKALARPGEVAAIYMGKKSARFVQGRLLMHGADPSTPVTVVENASRADQRVIVMLLSDMEPKMTEACIDGPALTFIGLAPREAQVIARNIVQEAVS
ncbi:Siroheme synthase / Precorrin-2 oxidase / Sirohydrochlorin ferrochelatase [Rubellimicrobium mesophilum DSM 19309]|uniref:Siroheme synthase / Precorrin-2 oxidase / Sirohydrochlorin ferrochelatase n=1 Tax=Rubellimicrobium mesophilum DSM 19309 TaxID=442562 RepID=A0A017HPT0_9RHOB|nr:siroheme synthase CysG [Rubellimicrobium mesophilum]EYD75774.1 Siroheme synthase / Precorrin-2 oxidase / Sirohydrochlorin ferrochelatase [Rubellimicrobium mesophilum DSM 19309]